MGMDASISRIRVDSIHPHRVPKVKALGWKSNAARPRMVSIDLGDKLRATAYKRRYELASKAHANWAVERYAQHIKESKLPIPEPTVMLQVLQMYAVRPAYLGYALAHLRLAVLS